MMMCEMVVFLWWYILLVGHAHLLYLWRQGAA